MKCVICDKTIKGHGHNPYPLSDKGRCCDRCNAKVVIARISMIKKAR